MRRNRWHYTPLGALVVFGGIVSVGGCSTTPYFPPEPTTYLDAPPPQPPDYETPPVFAASEVLAEDVAGGPYHRLKPEVVNDGLMNHYRILTAFGEFDAVGEEHLHIRLREVYAIAALRGMRKSEIAERGFETGMRDLLLAPYREVRDIVRNPFYLVRLVPESVVFALGVLDDVQFLMEYGLSARAVKAYIGFYGAKRGLARHVGVDHYSPNPVLQRDLEQGAWSFFAGGLPPRAAEEFMPPLPIPAITVVRRGGRAGDLVEDIADEVRAKTVHAKMRRMKIPKAVRKEFFDHDVLNTRHERAIVEALFVMKDAENRAGFLELVVTADDLSEAYRFQRTAQMMAAYHQRVMPVDRLVVAGEWALFVDQAGKAVAPVYADYLAWTEETARAVTVAEDALAAEGPPLSREFWVSGDVSSRSLAELGERGWSVSRNVLALLEPPEAELEAEREVRRRILWFQRRDRPKRVTVNN